MKTKKYFFPNMIINQMNTQFKLEIATTKNNQILMEQMKVASQNIEQFLIEVNRRFSPFAYDSLVSRFQRGDKTPLQESSDFAMIYNSTVLAEQMTEGVYTPYFAGKYDPNTLVQAWALEQAFNKYVTPLLENPDIEGIWLNNDKQIKVATKPESDFKWAIDINDSNKEDPLTTYYLQNGVIAISENDFESVHMNLSDIKQTIVIGQNIVEASVWAEVGLLTTIAKFEDFVEAYDLSGLVINKEEIPIAFSDGAIETNEKKIS
ncbi:FAD:protein FMN transferase [Companilactobacillus futsaii]|uniref:FAD:protein FMN transferase n=2 Tax=Companilactobacillus futsaii TaxID=938155 RepID=A0A5B7T1J1_9LACO|nr:FAD:protein FMN transferase [Companilactobacillus futsaii]KRK95752.1 hypothetical protein FC88_GL002198 [Companilactobacillus futsaii JCM 17355]QCX25688.1 hypothetical protein FG051_11550 [Companilactobacillus futsaii]